VDGELRFAARPGVADRLGGFAARHLTRILSVRAARSKPQQYQVYRNGGECGNSRVSGDSSRPHQAAEIKRNRREPFNRPELSLASLRLRGHTGSLSGMPSRDDAATPEARGDCLSDYRGWSAPVES
jgi:hypothetical protein